MYYLGVYIRPFIFKAFLRAGDALGPLCSIWDATKHLLLMGGGGENPQELLLQLLLSSTDLWSSQQGDYFGFT